MRRLIPAGDPVAPEDAYGDLGLAERAEGLTRPYVVANMVVTVDGRATLGGRTKDISSLADRELFHALREQVDAVMAGTGTIAIERYGPLVRDEERRARRARRGLEPSPLLATATRSLELPVEAPLFQDPGARIVVLTSKAGAAPAAPAQVSVEHVPAPDERTIDLVAGLERLRSAYEVRTVLMEGGPTLLAAMAEAGALDELFLTTAPILVGGGPEVSLLEGAPLPEPLPLRVVSLLEDEGFFFARYAVGA